MNYTNKTTSSISDLKPKSSDILEQSANTTAYSILPIVFNYGLIICVLEALRFLLPLSQLQSTGEATAGGLLYGTSFLPAAIFAIWLGRVNDSKNGNMLLFIYLTIIAIMAIVLGTLLSIESEYKVLVFVSFVIFGAGYGHSNLCFVLSKKHLPAEALNLVNARFGTASNLASLIIPMLLGFLLYWVSSRTLIWLTIPFAFAAIIFARLMVIQQSFKQINTEKAKSNRKVSLSLRDSFSFIISDKWMLSTTIIMSLLNAADALFYTGILYSSDIANSNAGWKVGLAFSLGGIGALFASLIAPAYRKKFSPKVSLLIPIVAVGIIYTSSTFFPNLKLLVLIALLQGFVTMLYIHCIWTIRHERAPKAGIGSVVGITGFVYKILIPIMAPLGGFLFDLGSSAAPFILAVILTLVAIIILYMVKINTPPTTIVSTQQ